MVSIEPSQLVYLRCFLDGNSLLSGVGGSEAELVGWVLPLSRDLDKSLSLFLLTNEGISWGGF